MTRLTEQILSHATGLPEGAPVSAKSLLHLGNRAAVDQALSRLTERGQLIRAGRGVYLRPIASRFGTRTPSVEQAVEALATQKGEIIVSNGAAAANALGLTTQVPVRSVYLTSGRSRKMRLGKQVVELRHAPRWQLALANRPAGEAVRALAWLGPEKAEAALTTLKRKMPPGVFGPPPGILKPLASQGLTRSASVAAITHSFARASSASGATTSSMIPAAFAAFGSDNFPSNRNGAAIIAPSRARE